MTAVGASGASGSPAPRPAPEVAFSVSAVARRLGVAPATLRTWDRRYGIGPSSHAPGSHRRYLADDVARLEVMRRLTREGVNPADAARLALATEVEQGAPSTAPVDHDESSRGGGGSVVALPDGSPAARGLARAAMALDAATTGRLVREALEAHGVVATWDDLLVPVLVGIGRRWETTGRGVDVEHLLSECVIGALHSVTVRAAPPVTGRPILLASAEDEMHALPLHAVSAALAERGVASRVLGARVPREALASASSRTGAAAVFVWSQLAATGHRDQLDSLPVHRPATLVVVGGPGWPADLPAGTERADGLADAVDRLVAAV